MKSLAGNPCTTGAPIGGPATTVDAGEYTSEFAPDCPVCTGASLRLRHRSVLLLDCSCTACGASFTSPLRRAVLYALSERHRT